MVGFKKVNIQWSAFIIYSGYNYDVTFPINFTEPITILANTNDGWGTGLNFGSGRHLIQTGAQISKNTTSESIPVSYIAIGK